MYVIKLVTKRFHLDYDEGRLEFKYKVERQYPNYYQFDM